MTPVKTVSTIAFQASPTRFSSSGLVGLMVCLLLGLAYTDWLLPAGFIEGTHPYWRAQNEDITVYIAGFNAYLRAPWQWPLFRIDSLNWPEGTLTTFVDAIPLYALSLKLLAPQSWIPFNPYGVWVAGSLVLQAMGAWWVLREARVESWVVLLSLTLLLLSFPAWIQRMGHISLMSQWIVVFAIALTLRSARLGRLSGFGWCGLLFAAFLINLYLFTMAALVFVADLLRSLRLCHWKSALGWPLAIGLLLGATALCTLWPIPGSTGAPDTGFGVYSMNLLAPLTGSQFFSLPRHTQEQFFEGYNYLGLGGLTIIAGALIGVATRSAASGPAAMRHPLFELWAILLLVAIYALSNRVYLGQGLVFTWSAPDWAKPITGQLRASGRFFWLVGYALLIFSVISVYRRLPRVMAASLLVAATCLQFVDLWPDLSKIRTLEPKPGAQVIDDGAWERALAGQPQTLYFYPKFKCGQHSDFFVTLLPVMRYASEHGLNINTGYIARHNPPCGLEADEIAASDPTKSVYLFVSAEYSFERINTLFPANWPLHCQPLDFATLCHVAP